jgi:hypothetical protein
MLKNANSLTFAVFAILKLPLIVDVESSIVCIKLYTLAESESRKEMYRVLAVLNGFALNCRCPLPRVTGSFV